MSQHKWLTPEKIQARKKRNKVLMYASFFLGTILISAFVTILASQL